MATETKTAQAINADEIELKKFGELAHKWWDKNSEFKPLHEINPLRLDYIDSRADLKSKRVLDVGCGGGILSESMYFKGADVTGIDLGEKALNVAKLHQYESGSKVDYRLVSVEQLASEQPASFDVVTCMEMLEHVPDPQSIINACFTLLKPNGVLVLSTINRNPKSYLFAVIGAEYLLRLLPRGTHDYEKFITPAELDRFAQRAGCKRQDLIGLHYNPLIKHYWLAQNVDVNYMMAVYKPQ